MTDHDFHAAIDRLREEFEQSGGFDHDDRHYAATRSPEEIAQIEAEAREALAGRRAQARATLPPESKDEA